MAGGGTQTRLAGKNFVLNIMHSQGVGAQKLEPPGETFTT